MQERDEFDPTMIGRPVHAVWEPIDRSDGAERFELMGVLEFVSVSASEMSVGVKTVLEAEHNGWTNIDMGNYMLTVRVVV